MKNFKELSAKEKFEIVSSIKCLELRAEEYIFDCEVNGDIMDKVNGLKSVDYSIGDSRSYLKIKEYYGETYREDAEDFFVSLLNVVKMFGASERCEKQMKKCDKLYDCRSNLFTYEAKKLCQMYFEDDIEPTLEYVENFTFDMMGGDYKDDYETTLEIFLEPYEDDIVWDEDSECWEYLEHHKAERAA